MIQGEENMAYQVISLLFLIAAIVLGFTKKINVGIVSMGLAFILGLIDKVSTNVILGGFPSKLFITLLGTMFFFCLLQDNHTLKLLLKKWFLIFYLPQGRGRFLSSQL